MRRPSQLGELRARLDGVRQALEQSEREDGAEDGPGFQRDELRSLVDTTTRAKHVTPQLAALCARTIAKQLRLASSSLESEYVVLGALRQLLSSRRLDFETFVRSGGMESLFTLPVATRGVKGGRPVSGASQHEELYLQCLDQLMSGGYAREASPVRQRRLVSVALLRVPGCLSSLAIMLSSREFRVKLLVLQLLTRGADLLPLAGHAVSDALESLALTLRAEPEGPGHRYAPLVALMTAAVDEPVLQCHCMRLVNALVSLPPNMLARASTRKELETGVGLRERLKALHRTLPHESSDDINKLKQQLGLYAKDSKEDGRALKSVRKLHNKLELDSVEDLQLAVGRWVCRTRGAKQHLMTLLKASLSGTLACAIQGVPGDLGTADERVGGVLHVLKRRWVAVAGFVTLAAEAAQEAPEPDDDEDLVPGESWADKDPCISALHRVIELTCELLYEIGGPGSEAAAAAEHIRQNLASLLFEMFIEWLVDTHGFDVADQLLEQGDLSGFDQDGPLRRMQWEYSRLHSDSQNSIVGGDTNVPSVSEVAALRREVTDLQRKVVHSTQQTIAARRALRAKEAEAALISADMRRLEALHAAHAAECVQYYAVAVSCRERRAQTLQERPAAPETAEQKTLDENSVSALLGPPLVKVEAPPLGCAVVRVGVDETAHLPLPLPNGRTVGFKVPGDAKPGDLLFVKPETNEDPTSTSSLNVSNKGSATDEAEHLKPQSDSAGVPQHEPEPDVKHHPEPEPEPQPELQLQPQPEPQLELATERSAVHEAIPDEVVRGPPPSPEMPTKRPQEAILCFPWSKIPAAHQSAFAGANSAHWDPAKDDQLGLSTSVMREWFSVTQLPSPGPSLLLPKRALQINSELAKLDRPIPNIVQALKGDGEGQTLKRKGPVQKALKLDLQGWKTLQRILPGATVDGVQNPVAAVNELSVIQAASSDSKASKPRPPAERLALAMVSIPGVEQRVSLRILEEEWKAGVTTRGRDSRELLMGCSKLKDILQEIEKAYVELREAEAILGVLFGLILQIGNYVNGGTSRGGAYGFALKDCLRLREIKAEGGRELAKNMLEFVVLTASHHAESVDGDGGALLRWPEALPHLQPASKQSLKTVGVALTSWTKRVAAARLDTAALRQALPAGACRSWDAIVDKVSKDLLDVHRLYTKLSEERTLLAEQFGMEPLDQAREGQETGVLSSFDAKQRRLEATLEASRSDSAPEEIVNAQGSSQLDELLSVLARFASEWEAAVAQLRLNV